MDFDICLLSQMPGHWFDVEKVRCDISHDITKWVITVLPPIPQLPRFNLCLLGRFHLPFTLAPAWCTAHDVL